MGFADIPADTDAERIIKALDMVWDRLDKHSQALNNLGENQQWVVDNAKGIFEMFHNPMFSSMLSGAIPAMAGGMMEGMPGE